MKNFLNRLGVLNFFRSLLIRFFLRRIFNGQLGKYLIDEYDGYWGQEANRSKGSLGFGYIHYAIITVTKSRRILCVGSQKGFIPAICALACKDNGLGSVDFVDAGYDQGHDKAWSGIGFWNKIDPKNHFNKLGLDGWINIYVMTSKEFSEKFSKQKYDYIYIDGDHTYEGVTEDYNLFWPRLNKFGFMSFHDISPKGYFAKKYKFGVWRLWDKVSKLYPHIHFVSNAGFGLIQKN